LDASADKWEDPAFAPVRERYWAHFAATGGDEGIVMGRVLAYAMGEAYLSERPEILPAVRADPHIRGMVMAGAVARVGAGEAGDPFGPRIVSFQLRPPRTPEGSPRGLRCVGP
jgi:hypothetical protein